MSLRSGSMSDSPATPHHDHDMASSSTQFEPYHSDAFRQIRARLQSLSTSPATSPPQMHRQLTLPSGSGRSEEAQRDNSPTPSPPESVLSIRPSSQTPHTKASDSSASNCTDDERNRQLSQLATGDKETSRPTFFTKRVLSEGDIISPRPRKRSCGAIASALRKRSLHADLASAGPSEGSSRVPSVTKSWRMAAEKRRLSQLSKAQAAKLHKRVQQAKSSTSSVHPETTAKIDVLPELRLLSATRTAPIGWTQFRGTSAFLPSKVEVYDEREAKQAPERQRFWPIIDQQLDYTGARMLSLSAASQRPIQEINGYSKPFDDPISPKSGHALPPAAGLLSLNESGYPIQAHAMASSDEDMSPLTPGAKPRESYRPNVSR